MGERECASYHIVSHQNDTEDLLFAFGILYLFLFMLAGMCSHSPERGVEEIV